MLPLAVTSRTFGDDWTLHLWLVRQQEMNIQANGRPGLFLSAQPLGAFYPIFAFVGSGLYTVGGYLAILLGDRPIVAYKLLYLGGALPGVRRDDLAVVAGRVAGLAITDAGPGVRDRRLLRHRHVRAGRPRRAHGARGDPVPDRSRHRGDDLEPVEGGAPARCRARRVRVDREPQHHLAVRNHLPRAARPRAARRTHPPGSRGCRGGGSLPCSRPPRSVPVSTRGTCLPT